MGSKKVFFIETVVLAAELRYEHLGPFFFIAMFSFM